MRFHLRAVALAAALLAMAAAPVASAQSASTLITSTSSTSSSGTTGTISCTAGFALQDPPARSVATRPSAQQPDYINLADCDSNGVLSFVVTTTPTVSNATFQVWASSDGSDCTLSDSRSQGFCVPVGPATSGSVISPIDIPFQDITSLVASDDGGVCDGTSGAPLLVTLYFLVVPNDTNTDPTVYCTDTEIYVDLLGPAEPDNVTAGIADSALLVSFDLSTDSDVESYQVYCDDISGGAGGAGGSGGATTGASASIDCSSTVLVPGEVPTTSLLKGSGTASPLTASGLENGHIYACGVAAVDTVGNPGVLSELSCAPPEPTEDFFTIYLRDGGQAGCSLAHGSKTVGALAGGVGLAAIALLARRKRRPRRARKRSAS